jgi:type VI protein secretion system component Hcp
MAWSNIFLQLMAGDTPPGLPVIGEGLLEGWWTAIELTKFSWSMDTPFKAKKDASGLGGLLGGAAAAAGGMVAGNVAGAVGGAAGIAAAAVAAAAAAALLGGDDKKVNLGKLVINKRFDIASSRIHACIDKNIKIQSALLTVLHIKQGSRAIHEPGFTLLATNGYFESVKISMEKGDKGVEVTEELELQFNSIVISYSKQLGVDNIPMPPFTYTLPTDPTPSSLPGL